MIDVDNPEQLIGAVLDRRFRLTHVIGQGGLGVVFEAQSVDGSGTWALKILRAEFCENADIVARFLSEVRASSRVEHPSVAKIYEATRSADGTPYLVMELIPGQPLANRMNRGRVPVEQATMIVANILRALAAAHAAGVVHRDLKPGNVILQGDPINGTDVKILDFGIALVIDAAGGMQRKTRTGMLLGTPGYMSPEQIRNVKYADLRADLWSVGIIFYELLAGVPAYEAENEFARVTKVLTSEPIPIETAAPQFAHWGPFFRRALARDVEQRFQTATEMLDALDSVARSGQMPQMPVPVAARSPQTAQSPVWGQPDAAAPGSPAGHYASAPPPGPSGHAPAAPSNYGSVPPPAYAAVPAPAFNPATPGRPRFGGDTALSAGIGSGRNEPSMAPPSVEVVSVRKRGIHLPLALVVMITVIALMVGFTVGMVVGKW